MALRFKLRQLEMFVAVAEELNLRAAAARLHMTQPPLSRQMQELEAGLNARLLERSRRGVTLTPAGARLLAEARTLLADCDAMAARVRRSVAEPVKLTLGLTTVGDTEAFAQLLPLLHLSVDDVKLGFKRQGTVKSVRDLRHNRLDAAIIGMPSWTDGLTVRRLYRDEFCVALPAAHRLRGKKTIALRELNDSPLFWFKRDGNPGFYDHCEEVFEQAGFAPQRLPEPADHHVLLSMIANQGGVALIPASLRAIRRPGVIYRTLSECRQLYIDVSIAYAAPLKEAMLARLIDALLDHFQQPRINAP